MHRFSIRLSTFVSALFLLASCSSLFDAREDFFAKGRYQLEADTVEGCTLDAAAFEENGHPVVRGRMTLRHHAEAPLSGDVTGELRAPNGELLETKSAPFRASAHGRHLHSAANFQLVFEQILSQGSTVHLVHRCGKFEGFLRFHPDLVPYEKLKYAQREWLVLSVFRDPSISLQEPSVRGLLD